MLKMTLASRLGRNVKRHRTQGGLTLNQLARLAGVAKATLSKIEAGVGNPRIDTLEVLADGLGLTVGELLADTADENVHVLRAVVPSQPEQDFLRLIDRLPACGMAEIFEDSFKAGTRHEVPPHPLGVVEHLLLYQGYLTVGPIGHEIEIGPGDYIWFRADTVHAYLASGGIAKAVLVLTYPVGGHLNRDGGRHRNEK